MTRQSIEVEGLGHPGFPIPAASRVGNIVASGGIRGVDRETGVMPADAAGQVKLMFTNVMAVAQAASVSAERIVKMTFWVTSRECTLHINELWLAHFPDPASRPARHVMTYDLPGGMLAQCDFLAVAE
ncbi:MULTISPECIES: RidA family protein [Sphingobium]|uniref:RidA family protein n=1 Tax=Sphingobium TaxID=165695 RepID=UPI00159BF358|nr:Rid family hydrolase [Sphingobium sp. 15-1]